MTVGSAPQEGVASLGGECVAVTDADRRSFQRWLRRSTGLYDSKKAMRPRAQRRADHHSHVTGAGAVGGDLRESVATSLAALLARSSDDPEAFIRLWLGSVDELPDGHMVREIGESVIYLRDAPKLQDPIVLGLWCQDDGCRRFIRPLAVRAELPPHSFGYTAVCAKCDRVTAVWIDGRGTWVRTAPELVGRDHPLHTREVLAWASQLTRPPNRPAPRIS